MLRLKVTPDAPGNAVLGEADGVIRLKLRAPAVDAKANAALLVFLAGTRRVPGTAVSLQGGRRSRLKQVEIRGLDDAGARRRLMDELNLSGCRALPACETCGMRLRSSSSRRP